MNWSASGYQKAEGEAVVTMLRGSLQAGKALLSGQWSQQITKFTNGNAWHLVEKVDAFSPAPVVQFSFVALHHDRGFPQPPTKLCGPFLARVDVIRMLYIHQVSNKWKQPQGLFHAFVKSGCKLGTHDLDLVKHYQIARSMGVQAVQKVGSMEFVSHNQARKKDEGAGYEGLYCEWKNGDRVLSAGDKEGTSVFV